MKKILILITAILACSAFVCNKGVCRNNEEKSDTVFKGNDSIPSVINKIDTTAQL